MAAAVALSWRGRGVSVPNPNVGCLIVKDGIVVGRGWTQAGGRPHAEAMALAQAGMATRAATAYVTLEPCAHESERGPSCADSLIEAGIGHVVVALVDPDPRTAGQGIARLAAAGVAVTSGIGTKGARRAMAGSLSQMERGRPYVTLKLATSLDGCIATAQGESQWITGEAARAHGHLERALADAIVVGRGTYEADHPRLDVRLAGLEGRSPARLILSSSFSGSRGGAEARRELGSTDSPLRTLRPLREKDLVHAEFAESAELKISMPNSLRALAKGQVHPERLQGSRRAPPRERKEDWIIINHPEDVSELSNIQTVLVEGGALTAASFLRTGLVDRLLLYRAPILIGGGKACLGDIGLTSLADAHDRWVLTDSRQLGKDRLDVYEAAQQAT